MSSQVQNRLGFKVRLSKERLVEGLQLVHPVVPKSNIDYVVNGNALLSVGSDGKCFLCATDYTSYIRCFLEDSEHEGHGKALIPVTELQGLLKEMDEAFIDLRFENDSVHIDSVRGSFVLKTESADAFPDQQDISTETMVELDAQVFATNLDKSSIATSSEEGHYAFDSILIEKKGTSLSIVSTDGRRMALAEMKVSKKGGDLHALLSPRVVSHVKRLSLKSSGSIRFGVSGNRAVFDVEHAELQSTIREQGVFPEYRKLLPEKSKGNCFLSRRQLLSASRSLLCILSNHSKSVRFVLGKDQMELVYEGSSTHQGAISVDVESVGSDNDITFNLEYVLDGLQVMEGERITLHLNSQQAPVLWEDENDFRYILAPVFVSGSEVGS
ncbi:MAG: DNA polymerase III subunit beta [Planctomycetota bacterium]|jgi:DNA polymerase-3 subunit beta|nr:DNA polymerase III subunit beta [Planctomycetota bacterium]